MWREHLSFSQGAALPPPCGGYATTPVSLLHKGGKSGGWKSQDTKVWFHRSFSLVIKCLGGGGQVGGLGSPDYWQTTFFCRRPSQHTHTILQDCAPCKHKIFYTLPLIEESNSCISYAFYFEFISYKPEILKCAILLSQPIDSVKLLEISGSHNETEL